MNRGSGRRVFVVAIAATTMAYAPLGEAQTPDANAKAQASLKRGYELRTQGKCVEALVHFEASIAQQPTTKAYLNRAFCEETLHMLPRAYASYVAGKALAVKPEERELHAFAEEHVRLLRPQIALTTFRVESAPHLLIKVDDSPVEPGVPIPMDPGPHHVDVSADGYVSQHRSFSVERGETRFESLTLARVVAEPAAALPPRTTSPSPREEPPPSGSSWMTWAGASAIGVGVVGFVASTAIALTAKSDYDEAIDTHCRGGRCSPEGATLVESARSRGDTATVLFVLSGIVGATGLGFVLFAPSSRSNVAVRGTNLTWTHRF